VIEGINIEYGKIENCKIDTILASKMRWLVTSKKNVGTIEFNFENGNFYNKFYESTPAPNILIEHATQKYSQHPTEVALNISHLRVYNLNSNHIRTISK